MCVRSCGIVRLIYQSVHSPLSSLLTRSFACLQRDQHRFLLVPSIFVAAQAVLTGWPADVYGKSL